ncbi:maleylpyruvate isomerase N-terminal domain-containing protein [Sporichthya sp.]|uniref:maleylpyruvate isomerase N-terminal domain-containing protein n=1 Tax=Sporichthya sp. TaxID=65475 RepID=UPI0017E1CD9F|nr:maleylpyruvate isomerase N-terminal domain-containing protein [Sporichthya sp.]MBA3742605.1 maleylpyruvate isomerase N-terminal domain-containing protein [Sporichthya sp.]
MDLTTRRDASLKGHEAATAQFADLILTLDRTDIPVPGSTWTVRDVAAHLVTFCGVYTEMARGNPPRLPEPGHWAGRERCLHDGDWFRTALAAYSEGLLADVPETDPAQLAKLVVDASGRFVDDLSRRAADQRIAMYWGNEVTVADMAGILLGEPILHGFDVAGALGRPWPIDRNHVALNLAGMLPALRLAVRDEPSRGLNVACQINLTGLTSLVVRFVDGAAALDEPGAPVDSVITADPVAWFLVRSGRMTTLQALTFGLISGAPDDTALLALDTLLVFP